MKEKVYFLHGLMGTGDYHFFGQIDALKDVYEVIAIDFPGHGSNPLSANEAYFETTLAWMTQYIEEHGAGHLIGVSIGSSIAIHLAINRPDLVRSMILTGYSPRIPDYLKEMMIQQYQNLTNLQMLDPRLVEQYKELHGERWFETLKTVLTVFTFHYPVVSDEQIQQLNIPVMIINGNRTKHERESACLLADLNKNISIAILPNSGLAINIETPSLYNEIIMKFLQGYQED